MAKMIVMVFFGLMLNGCATVATPENMDRYINEHRHSTGMRSAEVILDVPYKEAFSIVDQRLRARVLKADYENKAILCNFDVASYRLYTPVLAYFEEIDPNKTKVILKGRIDFMPYLPQQLKDDADLKKKNIR